MATAPNGSNECMCGTPPCTALHALHALHAAFKVSIRWMERGVFRGTLTPNPAVEKAWSATGVPWGTVLLELDV